MSLYQPTQPIIQMTAYTLNALKGWVDATSALDFVAPFDSSVTTWVPAGTCVTLNSSGNLILGVGNSDAMPLFTFFNSNDPTIYNYGGNPASTAGNWVALIPPSTGNVMLCLVATGGYELLSTNYDANYSYAPNATISSPKTTSGTTAPGQLYPATGGSGNQTIVGLVSRGVINYIRNVPALAFWPIYGPTW